MRCTAKHSFEDKSVARGNLATRDLVLPGVALGVVTLALFLPTVTHDFVRYDDPAYIMENPHLRDGLTAEAVAWAVTGVRGGLWAPLTWLSHALDITLFGLNPAGHHLVNVLLHTCNVLLLFLVIVRWTGAVWPAALAAALFAWHPLHVEPVAWAASRKDMLSTLFFLLALLAYDGYARRGRWTNYLLVAGAFALGLLSKPMVITLPCVLWLLDYWPYARFPAAGGQVRRALWLGAEKGPLFALAAGAAAVTVWAQRGGITPTGDFTLGLRIAHAFTSYWVYIGKTLWPHSLATPYYLDLTVIHYWKGTFGFAGLAAVTLALLWLQRGGGSGWRRALLAGWLWFLGTLVPVIGFVAIGHHAYADRFTYIPLIGLFTAVAVGLRALVRRLPACKGPVVALALVWLAVLAGLTWRQLGYWRNTETLFKHTVAVTERNFPAHTNLARYLMEHGRPVEAVPHYERAVALQPGSLDPLNDLGVAYLLAGRYEEAVRTLAAVAAASPDDPEIRVNLGAGFYHLGRLEAARAQAAAALRIHPHFVKARQLLRLLDQARSGETEPAPE